MCGLALPVDGVEVIRRTVLEDQRQVATAREAELLRLGVPDLDGVTLKEALDLLVAL